MRCRINSIIKTVAAWFDNLTNYPTLGSNNTNVIDILVGMLLVISPILQHYKGIGVNAGILVLILCLPYVCVKLLLRFRSLKWKAVLIALPLVLFQLYRVVAHGTSFMELAHAAVLCGYFIAIVLGGINLKYVARSAYLVAMAAGIGIIVQSLCYYLFDFHLQLVATDWLLEESNIWVKLAQTGIIGVTGTPSAFYRPSAFFLEPSHMFLYFVPNLFLLLLTPQMNWVKRISAIILSVGLILSTSGMGIALVVGVWLLHLGFGNGKENLLHIKHLFTKQNILRCISFVMIFAVVALSLPFLRYSILRVFMGSQVVNDMIMSEEPEKEPQPENMDEPVQEPDDEPVQEPDDEPVQVPDDEPVQVPDDEPVQVPDDEPVQVPDDEPVQVPDDEPVQVPDDEPSTALPEEPETPSEEENPGSTAISGRMERAISLIRYRMSGAQYIIGVSDSVDVDFNLPGFFNTMYKYGIIGTLLSYIFYLCCAIFGKGATRWIAIIILGISLVSAHTHGTFYMLFYVLMLMDGIASKAKEDLVLESID